MSHVDASPLASYSSLRDPHLSGYFSHPQRRKHLVKTGLIRRNGRLVSENEYRQRMAQKEHRKHVRDVLAQAIVHKALDMERQRQVSIRMKLEEIAKLDLVARVRADENKKSRDSYLPLLSSHRARPKSAPSGKSKSSARSDEILLTMDASGMPVSPASTTPRSGSTSGSRPASGKYRPRSAKYPKGDLDDRHLYSLDQHTLHEYKTAKNVIDSGGGPSPYVLPAGHHYPVPTPPRSARTPRYSGNKKRSTKSASASMDVPKNGLMLHRTGPVVKKEEQVHSMVQMTLHYFGTDPRLSYEKLDPRDEVLVLQQHCGGSTLPVFRGLIQPSTDFTFISRRHRGFPFGLTIYVNGVEDFRVSTCCEYKHSMSAKLGGHFGIVNIEGGSKCYKCVVEEQYKKKPVKKKKEKKEEAVETTEVEVEDGEGRESKTDRTDVDVQGVEEDTTTTRSTKDDKDTVEVPVDNGSKADDDDYGYEADFEPEETQKADQHSSRSDSRSPSPARDRKRSKSSSESGSSQSSRGRKNDVRKRSSSDSSSPSPSPVRRKPSTSDSSAASSVRGPRSPKGQRQSRSRSTSSDSNAKGRDQTPRAEVEPVPVRSPSPKQSRGSNGDDSDNEIPQPASVTAVAEIHEEPLAKEKTVIERKYSASSESTVSSTSASDDEERFRRKPEKKEEQKKLEAPKKGRSSSSSSSEESTIPEVAKHDMHEKAQMRVHNQKQETESEGSVMSIPEASSYEKVYTSDKKEDKALGNLGVPADKSGSEISIPGVAAIYEDKYEGKDAGPAQRKTVRSDEETEDSDTDSDTETETSSDKDAKFNRDESPKDTQQQDKQVTTKAEPQQPVPIVLAATQATSSSSDSDSSEDETDESAKQEQLTKQPSPRERTPTPVKTRTPSPDEIKEVAPRSASPTRDALYQPPHPASDASSSEDSSSTDESSSDEESEIEVKPAVKLQAQQNLEETKTREEEQRLLQREKEEEKKEEEKREELQRASAREETHRHASSSSGSSSESEDEGGITESEDEDDKRTSSRPSSAQSMSDLVRNKSEVFLDNIEYNDQKVRQLCEELRNNHTIRSLRIVSRNNTLLDHYWEEIVDVLKSPDHCPQLTSLHLQAKLLDRQAVARVADIVAVKPLNYLGIHNTIMRHDGVRSLVMALTRQGTLGTLELVNVQLSDLAMKELASLTSAGLPKQELRLDNNTDISPDVWGLLFSRCANNHSLVTISLSGCDLTKESVERICDGLVDNNTLQKLNIEYNRLDDSTVYWIKEILYSSAVNQLEFEKGNYFSEERVEEVMKKLGTK